MFYDNGWFDQDLAAWDVSNVEDMSGMFGKADDFEGSGLNSWNVGKVKSIQGMFARATAMANPLNNWSTNNCTDMSYAFKEGKLARHALTFDEYAKNVVFSKIATEVT